MVRVVFISFLKWKGGDTLMELVIAVLENTITVFFATLAAGYAKHILNRKKGQKKNSPAPRKRKGSSSKN